MQRLVVVVSLSVTLLTKCSRSARITQPCLWSNNRSFNPLKWSNTKRLFENGARPCALRPVASKVSTTGVVMSTYVPAGDIPLGSLSQAEPSAKELTRRAKMATDAT